MSPLPLLFTLLAVPAWAREPTQPFPPDQPMPPKPPARSAPSPVHPPDARRLPSNLGVLTVETVTAGWPLTSRGAALDMMSRYGIPDEMTASALTWYDNGPWKRTIVHRDCDQHLFPKPHDDVLEQVVAFAVPLERYDDLARYNGSVHADRTSGELSVRCDDEVTNTLLLNLAVQVAEGELSVEAARRRASDAVMEWLIGGVPAEMRALQFSVDTDRTTDLDETVIPWTFLRDHPGPAPRRPGS